MSENIEKPGENDVFKGFDSEPATFSQRLRQPKFWMTAFIILAAVALVLTYYLSTRTNLSTEELRESIDIVWQDSRWVNKEVTPYGVTIVPAIFFKVKNVGEKPLKHIQFTGVFNFRSSGEQMSDGFTPAFREPLASGETSEEIFLKAFNGYKASSKAAFFTNRQEWQPVEVKLFARTSSGIAPIGTYPIKQEIEGIDESAVKERQQTGMAMDAVSAALQKSILLSRHEAYWTYGEADSDRIVIVPVIVIQVKNVGDSPLHTVSFKARFQVEKTGEQFTFGSVVALTDPLGPEQISGDIVIPGEFGYTVESLDELERRKHQFERLKVRVFAKTRESRDVLLGIFPIEGIVKGI